jgi:hypothetical protein
VDDKAEGIYIYMYLDVCMYMYVCIYASGNRWPRAVETEREGIS